MPEAKRKHRGHSQAESRIKKFIPVAVFLFLGAVATLVYGVNLPHGQVRATDTPTPPRSIDLPSTIRRNQCRPLVATPAPYDVTFGAGQSRFVLQNDGGYQISKSSVLGLPGKSTMDVTMDAGTHAEVPKVDGGIGGPIAIVTFTVDSCQ